MQTEVIKYNKVMMDGVSKSLAEWAAQRMDMSAAGRVIHQCVYCPSDGR